MSNQWNAETQAYADCERCGGQGTYPGAESGAGCGYCLRHRIAELERQRDDLAAALRETGELAISGHLEFLAGNYPAMERNLIRIAKRLEGDERE